MSSSIMQIALSGLNAAQAGLNTTSHNLANVNRPGYTRQQAVQGTAPALFSGSGYIGTGATVETVRRIYSEHLQRETESLQSQASHSSAFSAEIERLGNLLADPDTQLSAAIDGFFGAMQQVASQPAEPAARQAMLSAAQVLAQRFRDTDGALATMRQSLDTRIAQSVTQINASARAIANLNDAIVGAAAGGQPPNDLLDQRDALIAELNRTVGAHAVPQSDGGLNIFLSNGHALVVGATAQPLATGTDPFDASQLVVGANLSGAIGVFRPGEVVGGELGGLLEFRDETLAAARNAIGRLAMVLADGINTQHQLGQDFAGNLGKALFGAGAPLASASSANTGTGALSVAVADYGALTESDYRVRFDGAAYTVTRAADNAQWSFATLPQTVDGLTLSVAGAPAAGDSFLVQPTRYGASAMAVLLSSPSEISAAAPVRASASSANLGDAKVASLAVDTLDPNLLAGVTLTFTSASTFDVSGPGTGNPTGVAYVAGGTIAFNGWTLTLQGAPRAGDVVTVGPNTGGVGDNRNALRMAELASAGTIEGATYTQAYAQTVSSVGNRTREAQSVSDARAGMLEQSQGALASVSGVNLDEEAAGLLRYQQAYQAAGKVLAVANTLFEEILAIYR
jgi:flagellar hook-associated protein 1 FlgK